jgi:hypothetical protein
LQRHATVFGEPGLLEEVVADLRGKVEAAQTAYEEAMERVEGVASLLHVARKARETIQTAEETLRRVEEEAARLREHEARQDPKLRQLETELKQFRQAFESRLAALEQRPANATASEPTHQATPATDTPPAHTPSEEAVWQAARRAHEELRRAAMLLGGIVKVPELTDKVVKAVPGLSREAFHDDLQQWQQDDRLVLQVCNDRSAEPRAPEGIESPRGLLFYVEMK